MEGTFRVPHDDLYEWVGMNKHALETDSWQKMGTYSWPRTPSDMLQFLEQYRISTENVAHPKNQLHPPDISKDMLDLARIAVRHCRLPHPAVVKRMNGAVFPVIRGRLEQRGKCLTGTIDGRKIMYDDNTTPRWALLWSHGIDIMSHPKGWVFAHVWGDVKNPDTYTHLANLVMLPESFGGLSDKQGPLVPYLQYHAEATYGWRPTNRNPIVKPVGYDDLTWNYLDSIPDPRGFVRERMSKSNAQRVKLLRELLGWR